MALLFVWITPIIIIRCYTGKENSSLKILAMIVVLLINLIIGIVWICTESVYLKPKADKEVKEKRAWIK